MKIIWLMPECPIPANTGGRVVEWNRLKELGRENEIYLFVTVDDSVEYQYKSRLLSVCREVHLYSRKKSFRLLLKSIRYPYPAVSRWNKSMLGDIDACFKSISPDSVIVEFPQMLGNLSPMVRENAKIVVNQHNIEHLAMQSIGQHTNRLLKKLTYRFVARQLEWYEGEQYKKTNVGLYTFVSESDKSYFEKKYDKCNTLLSPIGTNVINLNAAVHSKKIVFIAKMSYQPNETGAIWFMNNVWQKVLDKISDAELFIVGKNPSDKLIEISRKYTGITVTGTVESVEPFYEDSAAVVVPILSGGGVKVKLIEGLGHGKIVIATNKGIEGTEFRNRVHVLATDSSEEFAEFCIAAINDPEQFDSMRLEANKLMNEAYSWQGIMSVFEDQLRKIIEDED